MRSVAGSPWPYRRAVTAVVLTTIVVTAASYLLPEKYVATGVGLGFMASTYWLVLRGKDTQVERYGLAFGGLLSTGRLEPRRLLRDTLLAIGWALAAAMVVFPPFVVGFLWWWHPSGSFSVHPPPSGWLDDVMAQLLVIALPEEAFFRGFLQSELDIASGMNVADDRAGQAIDAPPRGRMAASVTVLGAKLGWSTPISAAVFALGHFLTEPNPQRLAVFFPALLFSWLRARTGGVGAGILLHAASNLLTGVLGRGYGLF